jgi:hypothetical protein
MKNEFKFKTNKPTGKWRAFDNPSHHIKHKGKEVGMIDHEAPFKIRLMVMKADIMEDGNGNCPWKWITLTKQSESLQEAKDFLNEKIDIIFAKYNIRYAEN